MIEREFLKYIYWIDSFWQTGFFLLVKIHYNYKQMDVIYIFACLMQLDYVLTHTPGPTFSVVSKYEHNLERKSVFLRHV